MILIEMHMSNPGGRSQYIWSSGQPWPVPSEEDEFVTRIEVFGAEYDVTKNVLPGGRELKHDSTIPLRDWLPSDAPYISQLMRMSIETGAIK